MPTHPLTIPGIEGDFVFCHQEPKQVKPTFWTPKILPMIHWEYRMRNLVVCQWRKISSSSSNRKTWPYCTFWPSVWRRVCLWSSRRVLPSTTCSTVESLQVYAQATGAVQRHLTYIGDCAREENSRSYRERFEGEIVFNVCGIAFASSLSNPRSKWSCPDKQSLSIGCLDWMFAGDIKSNCGKRDGVAGQRGIEPMISAEGQCVSENHIGWISGSFKVLRIPSSFPLTKRLLSDQREDDWSKGSN